MQRTRFATPLLAAAFLSAACFVVGVSETRAADGKPIKIVSPKENVAQIRYSLNEHNYTIEPGQTQNLTNDRDWIISFDRGLGNGMVEYTLASGTYRFTMTDKGWEVYRDKDAVAPATPPTPMPPAPVPPKK